jgi:transglutaminase-like putative cysteine protease
MRVYQKGFVAFLLLAGASQASEPQGKIIRETWDAAFLDNAKAGYVHTITRAAGTEDQKIFRTTMELDLTVKRFNDLAHMRMESGTEETEEGKVVAVFMKQWLGKNQQLVVRGTVRGEKLHVDFQGGGNSYQKDNPWNSQVIGLYRQEGIFRERQAKPGMRFSYLAYQPEVTTSVRTNVAVKDYEDLLMPGSSKKQRLLRVEETSDKLQGVQLPPLTLWLDKELSPVRSQVEIQGLGHLTLYRTTRSVATATGGPVARVTDIGYTQLISLNKRIANPYETKGAVYRITVKGDDEPATTFARDGRQEVKNVRGNTFELHVRANPKGEDGDGSEVGDEFRQSCYFINSEDPLVQQHARDAVGKEQDPLKRARRIEKWVHQHMVNKNFTEAFATSDHVAKTMEGDCTEHAVLAAAMCRAVGIPSRAAVGLIYVDDRRRGPVLGFHMWAEAWVNGRWYPIDATLGLGHVGATHLKIADHSWHDMQSLTPLLPALRVLGKVSIEVVRVNGSD